MDEDEKPFAAERAKTGRSGCKRCKGKIETGTLRIARLMTNPFGGEGSKMKAWHHVNCLFDALSKARATTRRIESPEDDIEGWENLSQEDQDEIMTQVSSASSKTSTTPKKTPAKKAKEDKTSPAKAQQAHSSKTTPPPVTTQISVVSKSESDENTHHKDNSFRAFRSLCAKLADTSAYLEKSALVKEIFTNGTSGDGFRGDMKLWVKLLLPGINKRVYNLQSKQIIKLFSKILSADLADMSEDLEQGDVANTVKLFFEQSQHVQPHTRSTLTMQEVDDFLEQLSGVRSEEEQTYIFKQIVKRCTGNDLQMIIRLIKHDLRINAGAKHILDGIHPDAYEAFQSSRVLDAVIDRVQNNSQINITIGLMTPFKPMLAEACKSIEQAMKRCPNGMYSEIKYDGERVQVHKQGKDFKYFSRNLKPVLPNKVKHFETFIPEAFPHGRDLILDSEVLMIDTETGNPLPFGTLGIHKRTEFEHATVCLFVFDCLYYNGEVLLGKTIKERRKILRENMKEVPNHVVFSEMQEIYDAGKLEKMIARVLSEGLEGLVLKDIQSLYEPGKRHWLKVKKDYLCGGKMADTADLVPLGAWFGTGSKGGMMSIFLMCTWDPVRKRWCTVTKVHGGFDDKQLENLQTELKMVKISKEVEKVPSWLNVHKNYVPDFVAENPEIMPVWEITGAEFTKKDLHTAGISVRFPRVTRIRPDKSFKEATNLHELRVLFENSRHGTDVGDLFDKKDDEPQPSTSNKDKVKKESSTSSKHAASSSKHTSPKKTRTEESKPSSTKHTSSHSSPSKTSSSKRPATPTSKTPSKRPASPGKSSSSPHKKPNTTLDKFLHSDKSPSGIKKPLPDVFTGVKMVLPSWLSTKREELVRYFVAYGGELLSVTKASQATHALYNDSHPPVRRESSTVRHVLAAWLWDSIRAKTLQPVSRYAPKS